ncbi:MAG: 4Fe-4S dicluster domain-containing protein [Nitrospinota bacterium]
MEERAFGRRDFIKRAVATAGQVVAEVAAGASAKEKIPAKTFKKVDFLRPPGAVEEESFLKLCTRCDDCINACPHHSIKRASERDVEGTPVIFPREMPCYLCEDLSCIKACKTDALIPVERERVKMGVAKIKKKRCLAWADQPCQYCVTKCPFSEEAIYLDDFKPVIREEKCTGCGICEQVCLTINQSAPITITPSRYL